ncbi:dynamin family protein [Terribacillus saccharophilus]|uniref:dynamin family protein n=1 Tax=Terribacillus saccharophilus TaxID=361277 RepID=UPI002DCD65E3|nr:dynamin family protein [Terribacillus saccharophilus]
MSDRESLKEYVLKIRTSLEETLPQSHNISRLNELLEDMEADYYTVVVVGEFKNGKSTFINALLGQELMPADATPTTATINAIFHQDEPALHIVSQDGSIQESELSSNMLRRYTASGNFRPEEVKYLKVFTPADLLRERIVLVDTPGVNDVNEQRAEVTHQFIPRTDILIFITSIEAGMSSTEAKFLEEYAMKHGKNIIFVTNFIDRLDEEELDEAIEYVERRIQHVMQDAEQRVYPISAKLALEAKERQEEELYAASGFKAIEEAIQKKLLSSERSQQKDEAYHNRLNWIKKNIQLELETNKQLAEEDLDSLQKKIGLISQWFDASPRWEAQLQSYMDEKRDDITYMTQKSLVYFSKKLKREAEAQINAYQGSNVKQLTERQLPLFVQRQVEQWLEAYNPSIGELLFKLERAVAEGLSTSFKKEINIQAGRDEFIAFQQFIAPIEVEASNTNVKAGIIVGAVGTVAGLATGGLLLPLIGMAGLPFAAEKLAEKQLEKIRPELTSSVENQIDDLADALQQHMQLYIYKNCKRIMQYSVKEFRALLSSLHHMMDTEIAARTNDREQLLIQKQRLYTLEKLIKEEDAEYVPS